jgi:cell division protein FtsB
MMCLSRFQDLETRYATIESELKKSTARFLKVHQDATSHRQKARDADLKLRAVQSQLDTERMRSSQLEDQIADLQSRLKDSYSRGMMDAAADFLANQLPELQADLVKKCWKAALEAALVPPDSSMYSRVPSVTQLEVMASETEEEGQAAAGEGEAGQIAIAGVPAAQPQSADEDVVIVQAADVAP